MNLGVEVTNVKITRNKDFPLNMNNLTEQLIFEDKVGKNLHLEHIEDEILNYGIDGGRASINFIQSLRDMFAGATRSSINMTVKWDGAPAIFAGIDPEDGKFFVGKNLYLM